MHGDGRADVPGNAVQGLADVELVSAFRFEDEMLLALHHRDSIRQFLEADAWMRILGRDGFVAEVEREAIMAGFADDAGEQHGGGLERQVGGVFVTITKIPQHGGARTERAVLMRGVNAEGGRSASDEFFDDEALSLQAAAELMHRRKCGLAAFAAHIKVFIMNVAVVGVNAAELQPWRVPDDMHQNRRLIAGHDAGAAHATVDLDEHTQRDIVLLRGGGEKADGFLRIGDGGEGGLRIFKREFGETMRVWANAGHGKQHIAGSSGGTHLGLRDGGGLELNDAELDLSHDERRGLVSFHMRAQPGRTTGDFEHELKIVLDALAVQQQRGGWDVGFVINVEPGGMHDPSWQGRQVRSNARMGRFLLAAGVFLPSHCRMQALPTLSEIETAKALIRPHIRETPTYRWPLLEAGLGCELWLKHENHTPVGAFKIRGGLVYMDELKRQQPEVRGVIAATTGNHGQSIAFAAKLNGLRAVIVVPHGNNPEKNNAMRSLGAELIEHGREFQEALEFSRELAVQEGLHAVPSFHPWLVRGVATYALELFHSVADLDAVFVPIGLGSGFCGLAAAREALELKTKIIGVVSEHAPAYALSFQQRQFVEQSSTTRVAEGVACKTPNREALEHIMHHAHDIVTVNDDEAVTAMREIIQATHNIAEGAGALAYAALKKHREQWQGKRVACILTGGNASMNMLREVLQNGCPS